MQSARPNVLWISLEDVSPRFGCYGDPVARTPNIDRLCNEGVRYPNAFSVAGVCAPSRSAIITGMYPTFTGAHHMRTTHTNSATPEMPTPYETVPPHYVKPFTEYLRAAGYYCTNNFKTDYQFKPPVTAWDECSPRAHWRNREPGQPFFAVFNFTNTHESQMWERDERPLKTDPDAVTLPPYLPDTPKARAALARHYDNLETSDARVGEILRQLEEDGLADNTIVMLWSDHGEGLPRAKRWPYDAGIRVPLIVRWPGHIEPGTTQNQLVSMIDLGPTVLSLVGLDLPPHLQGQPFMGPKMKERTHIFATRDRYDEAYDMVRAVRSARYKYIQHFYPGQPYLLWIPYRNRHPIMEEMWRLHLEGELAPEHQVMFNPRPAEELYDVENDPYELRNLAEDPAYETVLMEMRSVLSEWRDRHDRWGDVSEAEMVQHMWPGGIQPKTAAPIFVPITQEGGKTGPTISGGMYEGPLLVQLHCATQGASIAYRLEKEGESPSEENRWRLYTEPLRVGEGVTTIRTKAIRVGYRESDERVGRFERR